MKTLEEKYPKIRITQQAKLSLTKLVSIERKERGSNVAMSDLASELIVNALRAKRGNGHTAPTAVEVNEEEKQ